jgi:hypothetical protein
MWLQLTPWQDTTAPCSGGGQKILIEEEAFGEVQQQTGEM